MKIELQKVVVLLVTKSIFFAFADLGYDESKVYRAIENNKRERLLKPCDLELNMAIRK